MPLGLVRTDVFDAELGLINSSKSDNTKEELTLKLVHGRGNKKETPEIIRQLVASESIAGAPAKLLAETFNVSESSVSAYKHNATSTSTYHESVPALANANDKVRDEISGAAKSKLMAALEAINFGEKTKPNIASAVARDMSTIMKNTMPDVSSLTINNNRTVVFAPRQKEEDDYDVIDVTE